MVLLGNRNSLSFQLSVDNYSLTRVELSTFDTLALTVALTLFILSDSSNILFSTLVIFFFDIFNTPCLDAALLSLFFLITKKCVIDAYDYRTKGEICESISNQHFPLAVSLAAFTADIIFILQRFHNSLDRCNRFSGLFCNFLLLYHWVLCDQF